MGGCKCSYKSCAKSSDGKTHFFHFPTKDIKRRNQWLINSNRLDFLKLAPPQLKNKVVCEIHFPENMFMNYKHDRLVHNAVPNKEETTDPLGDEENLAKAAIAESMRSPEKEEIIIGTCMTSTPKAFSQQHLQHPQHSQHPQQLTQIPITFHPPPQQIQQTPQPPKQKKIYAPLQPSKFERIQNDIAKSPFAFQPNNQNAPSQKPDNLNCRMDKDQNQSITLVNNGADDSNKHIIILPMDMEKNTQPALKLKKIQNLTEATSEFNKVVDDGAKVVSELKFLIEKHRRLAVRRFQSAGPLKKKVKSEFKPLSKASLYTQIVPYLSSDLAKKVHKEMFPSMRHIHRV